MTPLIPDRYQQLEPPLRGGMSRIYICEDRLLKRKVVVKYIENPRESRRLLDEIKALQSVRSKHVVQVYDLFHDSTIPGYGIVLEYVDGPNPGGIANEQRPLESFASILYQIATGIYDLHSQGIIHRDIKLDNIKIDGSGIVKIYDFGLARFSGINNETQGFAGTLGYAAPELLRADKVGFTESIDVYSFAVLAWYLSGENLPANLSPVRRGEVPSFAVLSLGIPARISNLLDASLCIDPAERPKIGEIQLALEEFLLVGRHKGLLVTSDKVLTIDKGRPSIRMRLGSATNGEEWSISINYSGASFDVAETVGDVRVNNKPVLAGQKMPKNCVITLGVGGDKKAFATFDISNPEVVP
jgi:serine/threonine protein kinase